MVRGGVTGKGKLGDILRTHLIEPALLRADDFEGLFAYRIKTLSDLVAEATGKPVIAAYAPDETERDLDIFDGEGKERDSMVWIP
ncbi:MAG: hypothetical protein FD153_198 [Rhodospirillaceae bacterium]|nr:MAG: hypothetical protein FD153_198 [Rhodospirillaceae bacterium]